MTNTITVPLNKIEIGSTVWLAREDVARLAEWAFFIDVVEYDGEWCRVNIVGHADEPTEEEDD